MCPALAVQGFGIQKDRHGLRIQGGAHYHQAEIGPGLPLEPAQERERQIRVQVALVEFINDHGDAPQLGILLKPPQQQPLGHKPDKGGPGDSLFEAHGIAHPQAQLFA